jgi:hypothetical protein
MSMSDVAQIHDDVTRKIDDVLRDVREEVNWLGGEPNSEYERGIRDTVARVDAIIEAKQAEFAQ